MRTTETCPNLQAPEVPHPELGLLSVQAEEEAASSPHGIYLLSEMFYLQKAKPPKLQNYFYLC